ncbi:hypothetical protein LOZ10_005651, partial [Ophidiomyces ophidiicola]
MWLPLGRGARRGLLEHLVDLLQGETLGLRHQEVGVEEAEHAERAPEEEHLGAEIGLVGIHEVGSDDGDDLAKREKLAFFFFSSGLEFGGKTGTYAVPEPIRSGGQTDTAGTNGERVDFTNDDPGARTPGAGEEEDVDTDEGDHGLDGLGAVADGDAHDGDNELADEHAAGAPDEQGAAADALDGPEGNRGGADVDEGGDEADEEGIVDGAEGLEEGGAEVEDEVDAGPLLHHLQGDAEDGATQVAGRVGQRAAEAVEPGGKVAVVRHDLQLVLVVGDDLGELLLDVLGVDGLAAEGGEGGLGAVEVVLLDEVAGRLGQQEEADGEDEGPEHLQGDGDAVGAGVGAVLGAVVDARGEQQADGDAELVAGDDGAAHLAGRDLGHVQDDDGGDEADPEAGDEAAGDEQAERGGGGLQAHADDEDGAAGDDGGATAEEVGEVAGDDGAKEGAGRQDGGDERLLRGGQGEGVGLELGGGEVGLAQVGELLDEVVHAHDAVDVAGV